MGSGSTKPKRTRIVVVFGATERQGASVISSLRTDSAFVVKAVTTHPDSYSAKALSDGGIETITVDQDDVNSIKLAIDGAYGVYVVTSFGEQPEKEIQRGRNIADACKVCKVIHVVFSGLNDVAVDSAESATLEAKHEIGKYMKSIGLMMTTVVWSLCYENILDKNIMKQEEADVYRLYIPADGAPFTMISTIDSGHCIHTIFKQGKKHFGKTHILAGHKETLEHYTEIMTKNLDGLTVKPGQIEPGQFDSENCADIDTLETVACVIKTIGNSTENMTRKSLYPRITDFGAWVRSKESEIKALI